ncbi:MAG: anthranilate synthase component I [Verrucomicrobia bacterium]|nr:anthranilate synthase component I [Verrucomicrobiota bacterium]
MIFPSEKEYRSLAQEYDLVPVYRELLADTETPVSVLQRFESCRNAFLLESMEGGEKWGRYSFVGIDPELLFETDHSLGRTGGLEKIRDVYLGLKVAEVPGLPRFFGGAVGFLGYEAINEFERMPGPKAAKWPKPRSRFLKADRLIVFDNVRHTVKVVVCTRPGRSGGQQGAYAAAVAEIEKVTKTLEQPAPPAAVPKFAPVVFSSNMTPDQYKQMVDRAREYIYAGDIIQVVLSQRFSAGTQVPPLQLYRALRLLNPSPYTFFLKIGEQTLVGSSPEVMVRLTGNRVETRPIAGTRPRGATEQDDRKLADELLSDEKEKAEHVMLVDLGRNDLGRISEPGSVQVTEYMVVERYSHVMHLVSHVEGILRKEFDAYDVMKATFPAGTLSGAPKIRAMEIIHELESQPRGVYGGAVGYVSYSGNMDLAITIRTMDICDGNVAVQAGAGIVFDSDSQKEYEETCHKARGMQKAVQMAAGGLEIEDGK